jgi:cyclic pyranopterin phosphate synthase
MPEEGVALRDKSHFMTSEEVIAIAKTFVGLGVKKIRLTGGEPLIKKDVANVIKQLGELPVELAISTNAVLVHNFIDVFKDAGIKSVNVSLDSLNAERFNKISRRENFDIIKSNIDLLIANDFDVKINVVVMRDVNEDEIIDFISWSKQDRIKIRFIEFMPFDGNKWDWDKKVSLQEILDITNAHFGKDEVIKVADKPNDTAKNYQLKDSKGSFGIISTVTNPFCDTCNRIRLTADGKIKNCLFSTGETDILTSFRNGDDIENLIKSDILNKKKERGGAIDFSNETVKTMTNRNMTSIGG